MTKIEHDPAIDYARAVEPPKRRASVLYRVLVALVAVPALLIAGRLLIALARWSAK